MLKVGDKFKIDSAEYEVLAVSEYGAKVKITRTVEDIFDGSKRKVIEISYISSNTDIKTEKG